MASDSDFKGLIGPVVRHFRGEPNKRLSKGKAERWGNNGSLWVDLDKDGWTDHEAGEGGGILDFVARETGCQPNGEASTWLRENGFLPDRPLPGKASADVGKKEIAETYDYTDETGALLYQAVRFVFKDERGETVLTNDGKPRKTFGQRRPEGGGWEWSVKGVRLVPYRLPDLLEAIALDRTVFVVEGEKKADRLAALGLAATCNPMGAGKWPDTFATLFAGAQVVILPDNDTAGQEHAVKVAAALAPVAASLRTVALPDLKAKADVVDWLDAGGTVEALNALVDATDAIDPNAPAEFLSKFRAVWFRDVDSLAPKRDWTVKSVLPSRGFALFYGRPKCGKSFLVLDLALSAAWAVLQGVDGTWFDHRVKPAGVVYVAAEGQDDFRLRMQAWRRERGLDAGSNLPFVLLPTSMNLRSPEGDIETLVTEILAHREAMRVERLIVAIDTVSRTLSGGDENSPVDMGYFVKNCSQIEARTAALTIGVHHVNAGSTPRGHTSLIGAVDVGIEVVKPEDGGSNDWTVRASKIGPEGMSHGFKLERVDLGQDEDGDAITTCVVTQTTGPGAKRSATKGGRRSDSAEIFLEALRNALADHSEPAKPELSLPTGMRIVHYDYFKREYALRGFNEQPTPEALRQAMKRHGDALVARHVIGRAQPYLWIARRDAE